MADLKAKKKLEEISVKLGGKLTSDQLVTVFKNAQNKYSNEKLFGIAKQYIKIHLNDGDKHYYQFETNVRKNQKSPYDALVIMLNNATLISQPTQKPQIAAKPANLQSESKLSVKSDFESPALSSTRVENNPPEIVVSEIKERLAQATQQSQTTNRQSTTFLRQSLNSTGGASVTSKKSPTKQPAINPLSTWTFAFGEDVLMPFHMKMPKPIVALPVTAQERAIIDELLFTLVGINGTLIVPKIKSTTYDARDEYTIANNWVENKITTVEFDLNEQITDSIKDIIRDILPLAGYYYQLQIFIEMARAPESGQVLQALSSALSKLVDDYYGTIAQLESMHLRYELNLHKLLFYLRPIIQLMETIAKTCNKLQENNTRGGNVLTYLHDSIVFFSGDKNSQNILIHLTQKAAEPYMEILRLWIFEGIIQDARNEFFVEDSNPERDENYFDDFWEKRYTVKTEKVPRFLEKQADVILRTGKYLNVVRECGKRIKFHQSQASLKFSHTDEQHYVNMILDAYQFASKTLMEVIMEDHDLMGHLLSVKRYFLLQQGDFIVQFMDACEHELTKSVDKVIPMRLENLLELTLRLSSAKHDKYQDNLVTTLMPFDIVTQMSKIIKATEDEESDGDYDLPDTASLTGIECFSFGYKTQWPISIILNQLAISKYQIIFRQLFYCKHVENFLCRVWIANNNAKKFDYTTSEQYRAAFTLRQRMMNAIQNLEYYMMVEVIEPVWHTFVQQILKAKNIDDVLIYHEDFLDNCLKNCMLTMPEILKCIMKMCTLCIGFCEFIEEAQRHFIDAELSSMLSNNYVSSDDSSHQFNEQRKKEPSTSTETFSEKVARYDTNFTQQTVSLLMKIHEMAEKDHSEKYVSLIHRINFNNFYSSKLNQCQ